MDNPTRQSLKNVLKKARESLSSTRQIAGTATSNLTGNIAAIADPQTRQDALRGLGYSFGNAGQNIRQSQTYKQLNPKTKRLTDPIVDIGGTAMKGISNIVGGTKQAVTALPAFTEDGRGKSSQYAKGGLRVLGGFGQVAASPVTGGLTVARNTLSDDSQIGNVGRRAIAGFQRNFAQDETLARDVQTQQISIPNPFSEEDIKVDPAMALGGMLGFVQSPQNKMLFKTTEKYLSPELGKVTVGNVARWLGRTGLRGSIEDIILEFPDMPDYATNSQRAAWVRDVAIAGALMEIGGQIAFNSGNKILDTSANSIISGVSGFGRWVNTLSETKLAKIFTDLKNNKTKKTPLSNETKNFFQQAKQSISSSIPADSYRIRGVIDGNKIDFIGDKQTAQNWSYYAQQQGGKIDIKNLGMQGGFAGSGDVPKIDPLESLKAEARKYDSAEEFVKAQGKPVFHGTDAKFKEFSLKDFGKTDEGFLGKGVYLTQRKGNAKQYGKNIVEAYPELKNPYVYDDSYFFGGFSPSKIRERLGLPDSASATDLRNKLIEMGHDGVVVNEITNSGIKKNAEVVVFDPKNIKTKSQLTDIYNQAKGVGIEANDKDLMVFHNLNTSGVKKADEMGGIPVPSLAITKKDIPFSDFGEISLVGNKNLATPAYTADVYSRRVPQQQYKLNSKPLTEVRKLLFEENKRLFDSTGEGRVHEALTDSYRASPKALDRAKDDPLLKSIYLKERHGIEIQPVWKSSADQFIKDSKILSDYFRKNKRMPHYDEPGAKNIAKKLIEERLSGLDLKKETIDNFRKTYNENFFNEDGTVKYGTYSKIKSDLDYALDRPQVIDNYAVDRKIKESFDKVDSKDYSKWLQDRFSALWGDSYFENSRGTKKPYNLDNLMQYMTGRVRGQESFFYGAGSIRSGIAEKMNTIEDIKNKKNLLQSSEKSNKIHEEIKNEVYQVLDEIQKYSTIYDSDTYFAKDEIGKDLASLGQRFSKSKVAQKLRALGVDTQQSSWLVDDTYNILKKLQQAPTSYFEAKPQRAVELGEFSGAIVPKDVDDATIQTLKRNGLKVEKFDPNVKGDRTRAVAKFNDEAFVLLPTFEQDEEGNYRITGAVPITAGMVRTLKNGKLSWDGKYTKGDSGKIQARIDELLGYQKGTGLGGGRKLLKQQLEAFADEPQAKAILAEINRLENIQAELPGLRTKKNKIKVKPKQSIESSLEQSLGFLPGVKQKFDQAIFNKDANAIKKLLPEVPQKYKDKFKNEIIMVLNQPTAEGPKINQNLDHLMNYPRRLKDLGYSAQHIDSIGSKEARQILDTNEIPMTSKQAILTGQKTKVRPSKDLKFIDSETSERMAGEAFLGEMEGQKEFKKIFAQWIGDRDVAKTRATEVSEKFLDVPENIAWDVVSFTEGTPRKVTPEIRKHGLQLKQQYDELIKEAKAQGMSINYLKQYVTHIWKETDEEIQAVIKGTNPKSKYSKKRTISTYQEGIERGLTPKYRDPARILEQYAQNLEKAKANLKLMESLKKEGLIVPASVARDNYGFKAIDAPGFGRTETIGQDGKVIMGSWYAPEGIADKVNRVFSPPAEDALSKGLAKTGWLSSKVQDITLSGGMPGTAINSFTLANALKEVSAGRVKSPVTAFVRSLSPKKSQKYFSDNVEIIKKMQKNNISVSSSYTLDDMIDKPLKEKMGLGYIWGTLVNDPTFKRFLPQLQIQFFKDIETQALKSGKTEVEAEEIAAKALKNFYGTIGTDESALRSDNLKNLNTTLFFAPHFREAMVNFWKNNIKAISPVHFDVKKGKIPIKNVRLNNPISLKNRNNTKFMLGATITYAVMNHLNVVLNGHPMSENPSGKEDKLLIPINDEQTIGIPFLSSIATVPRGMYRQGRALLRGDTADATKDAMSTYTSSLIKPGAEVLTNSDYFGNEIYDPEAPVREKLASDASHLIKSYNHPWIREILNQTTPLLPISDEAKKSIGVKTERPPLYQSGTQAMELPIRYYSNENIQKGMEWKERQAGIPYQKESDSPSNAIERIGTNTASLLANPLETADLWSRGEPIRKMRYSGDTIPEKALNFFDAATVSERAVGIDTLDGGDRSTQVDHIIPKWIGGREKADNLQILGVEEHRIKTQLDRTLLAQYEAGEINKEQAREAILELNSRLNGQPITKEQFDELNPASKPFRTTKREKSEIETKISNNEHLTADEWNAHYLSEININSLNSDSEYSRRKAEKDIFSTLSRIESSETLNETQKQDAFRSIMNITGITKRDFDYYQTAKQDNELKTLYLSEQLSKMMVANTPQEQIYDFLIDSRREVNGKTLLTSGVINNLVEEGLISYDDGRFLKGLNVSGTGKTRTTSKKAKTRKPKKISVRKINPPKIKQVKRKSTEARRPRIKRVSTRIRA